MTHRRGKMQSQQLHRQLQFGGVVITLEGWGILTGWRKGLMKFKGKHKALYLRYSNSVQQCRFGTEIAGKQPCKKWSGCPDGQAEHEWAACPHMKDVNHILGCISNSTAKQVKEIIIPSIWHLWDCISSTVSSYGLPKSRKILTQWSESSRGPPRLSGTGARSIWGDWGRRICSVLRKGSSRRWYCNLQLPLENI